MDTYQYPTNIEQVDFIIIDLISCGGPIMKIYYKFDNQKNCIYAISSVLKSHTFSGGSPVNHLTIDTKIKVCLKA